jgi:hypothetical protein
MIIDIAPKGDPLTDCKTRKLKTEVNKMVASKTVRALSLALWRAPEFSEKSAPVARAVALFPKSDLSSRTLILFAELHFQGTALKS